ncbi:hypothetical protein EMIT0P218_360019 [Pseudomonas sp. IT-P218]
MLAKGHGLKPPWLRQGLPLLPLPALAQTLVALRQIPKVLNLRALILDPSLEQMLPSILQRATV